MIPEAYSEFINTGWGGDRQRVNQYESSPHNYPDARRQAKCIGSRDLSSAGHHALDFEMWSYSRCRIEAWYHPCMVHLMPKSGVSWRGQWALNRDIGNRDLCRLQALSVVCKHSLQGISKTRGNADRNYRTVRYVSSSANWIEDEQYQDTKNVPLVRSRQIAITKIDQGSAPSKVSDPGIDEMKNKKQI